MAHIERLREGRQSEGLRKHGAAFPERHCFTLAFKGRRKNLDLAARGEEDARHWVQGLTKLMGRLQAMSQMEKLDQYPLRELWGLGDSERPRAVSLSRRSWIHGVLQRADRNKDNKMSFREVKSMLRMLNIDMDDVYASKLFKVPVLRCTTRCARCWHRLPQHRELSSSSHQSHPLPPVAGSHQEHTVERDDEVG